MSRPLLYSCFFPAKLEPDGQYERLARVLAFTATRHCPEWDVCIEAINPDIPAPATGNPSHAWNSSKLGWWNSVVQASPNGKRLVVIDADMMILRPLDDLWDRPFDIAYTIRDGGASRLPMNGGLVAFRVSPEVKRFMAMWQEVDQAFCSWGTVRGLSGYPVHAPSRDFPWRDRMSHACWHRKYAGMNQASFGYMLEEMQLCGLAVERLPCQEWNCCEWSLFADNTRVVHVKSRLRRAVFGMVPSSMPAIVHLSGLWHRLESEAVAWSSSSDPSHRFEEVSSV